MVWRGGCCSKCRLGRQLNSNGHACCGFLSSWEADKYSCPSVGHHIGCWPNGEYMDPCCLWISLNNHSQGEGLLHCVIQCVSARKGRDCGMGLDVSYVRYPGLWHVRLEEGECVLGQSVLKLRGQFLALMHKTASLQLGFGETLQPGFLRDGLAYAWTCLVASVSWRPSLELEVGLLWASPFLWSVWTASHQWSDGVPGFGPCDEPVGFSSLSWPHCGAMLDMGFDSSVFSIFSLAFRWYQQVWMEWSACAWLLPLAWLCVISRSASVQRDTRVCCFLILFQRGSTKCEGAGFLLWGQDEQGGGRLVLLDCNASFLSLAVELVSQLHPLYGFSCVFFLATHHQIICT